MKPFGSILLAVVFLLAGGACARAQTEPAFEPERPPAPTDMSIPAPAAPKVVKPAPPKNLPPPKQPVVGAVAPPAGVCESMVRSILVAVNQANFTGNYSVLRALGTRELQTRMTPEDLAKSFEILRKKSVDLTLALSSPIQFAKPPAVGKDGVLEMTGTVLATPHQIAFTIVYFPVAGYWRIDALTVSVVTPDAGAAVAAPPSGEAPSAGK